MPSQRVGPGLFGRFWGKSKYVAKIMSRSFYYYRIYTHTSQMLMLFRTERGNIRWLPSHSIEPRKFYHDKHSHICRSIFSVDQQGSEGPCFDNQEIKLNFCYLLRLDKELSRLPAKQLLDGRFFS